MSTINQPKHAPLLEEVSDRLLDYYFHKRLNGMQLDEIKESLTAQIAQTESIEHALKTIEKMEVLHKKRARYLRDARILLGGGMALLLAGIVLSGLSYFNAPQEYDFKLFYGLIIAGVLCLAFSFILKRSSTKR
jgi:DNA-binding transcriptional MerR regulator